MPIKAGRACRLSQVTTGSVLSGTPDQARDTATNDLNVPGAQKVVFQFVYGATTCSLQVSGQTKRLSNRYLTPLTLSTTHTHRQSLKPVVSSLKRRWTAAASCCVGLLNAHGTLAQGIDRSSRVFSTISTHAAYSARRHAFEAASSPMKYQWLQRRQKAIPRPSKSPMAES